MSKSNQIVARRTSALFCCLIIIVFCQPFAFAEWSSWKAISVTNGVAGINDDSGKRGYSVVWERPIAILDGPPEIGDGEVVVQCRDGALRAFNVRSGSLRWQVDLRAYLGYGTLMRSGKVLRNRGLLALSNSPPIFTVSRRRNIILAGLSNAAEGDVFAIDPRNGSILWRYLSKATKATKNRGRLMSGIATNDIVCAFRTAAGLTLLDLASGRELWNVNYEPKPSRILAYAGQPIIEGDRLYFGANLGSPRAYALEDGRLLWHVETESLNILRTSQSLQLHLNLAFTDPMISGANLFVADGNGDLYCLGKKDGSLAWRVTTGHVGALAADGGMLYAACENGLTTLSVARGAVLNKLEMKGGASTCLVGPHAVIVTNNNPGAPCIRMFDTSGWGQVWSDDSFCAQLGAAGAGDVLIVAGFRTEHTTPEPNTATSHAVVAGKTPETLRAYAFTGGR